MFDIGFWELTLIALILLVVVGPERLPAIATKAGRYLREAKNFIDNIKSKVNEEFEEENVKKHLAVEDKDSKIFDIVNESKKSLGTIKEDIEKSIKPK